MSLHLSISFLLFLSVLEVKGQDCNKAAANNFLDKLFKKGQYTSYESTQFRGYNKKLKVIKTPLLNKLLPDYCFFSTTFLSNDYEYLDVETALALSKSANKRSLLMHSPVFTDASQNFLNLFYGLRAKDTMQSVTLAKEIAKIFSSITYLGHINRLINLKDKKAISFELWHTDLSWRICDFYFDNTNKLTLIRIGKGMGRQKMIAD
jgi:hypothetical protein